MVLNHKKVACLLQVGGEILRQVGEFKYLVILYLVVHEWGREGGMECKIARQMSASAAVMWSMYKSVVV